MINLLAAEVQQVVQNPGTRCQSGETLVAKSHGKNKQLVVAPKAKERRPRS